MNGKTTRRGLITGAGAAGLGAGAFGLAGCTSARVVGFDPVAKSLDIANGGEPLSLDPHKASGTWENNLIGNMFVGLTTEDELANPSPGMAERWETSEDSLTWTFYLREAQWSDGEPVTAYDFEFGFRRILNPETMAQYASVLYAIKNAEAINSAQITDLTQLGVVALDERTLQITLEYPAPYLPALLKHYTAYPVPRHAMREAYRDYPLPQGVIADRASEWIRPANIVVNGAFKVTKWQSNYIVIMEKNPRFFDADNVQLEKLYFYPTTDPNVQARSVLSGERGWSTNFPSNQVDALRRDLPGFVRVAPYLLIQYVSFNTTRAPFNDARLRRALTMAVNREFIATQIYRTGEIPAYSNVPPGISGYPGTARYRWADEPLEQRQQTARALLEEAGYGPNNPLRFTFKHRSSGDNPRVAVVLQADWRAIAPWVVVELAGSETQVHYDTLRAKNFEAGDGGWVADFNDAKNYLYLHETRTGPQNYSGYSNPEYDSLMQQADRERDPIARAEEMSRAEQIMLDDAPICPTVFGVSRNLVHPGLQGYQSNVEDIHRARYFRLEMREG
jgi:oligopeptide transport system substrate-binding protein